jgi:putative NADH-flavin reductase
MNIKSFGSIPFHSLRLLTSTIVLSLFVAAPGAYAHEVGEASGVKIVIIGATAKTAKELIPQALWRGHEVTALARRPYRIEHAPHERLTIVKGDVYDRASIENALSGDEVVISVYGPRVDLESVIPETDLMSTGTTNIIEAMKAKGNTRLFATSSTSVQEVKKRGYTVDTPQPEGLTATSGLWFWNMRGPYIDMLKMEEIVLDSDLDATVLRPGQMLELPARGNVLITVDDKTPNRRIITYADFAAFILDLVESKQYVGNIVGVYSDTVIDFNSNIDFEAEAKKLKQAKLEAEADLAADAAREE